MRTRYHASYLTDGCWAPKRSGLFFVTRRDGWLDIWDYFYRQNETALSHKVSDYGLTCVKLNTVTGTSMVGFTPKGQGKYAAIGDMGGTITMLELCPSLYEPSMHSNEKEVISEIFDREKKKEEKLRVMRMQKEKKMKIQKALEEKLELQRQMDDE
jgi:dynein intermediate chain 2, axonemal